MRQDVSKIWILVDNKITCPKTLSNLEQEILLSFNNMLFAFIITFVYANELPAARGFLSNKLRSIALTLPWLMLGDFNTVLGSHKCLGGRAPNLSSGADFANMIADNNLLKIITQGAPFSWARCFPIGYIECNLDRALCNSSWMDFWAITSCQTLPRYSSNHNPLPVSFNLDRLQGRSSFRLKSMWLEHETSKIMSRRSGILIL